MYLELIYFSTMPARILIQVYIEISSYICIADYLKIFTWKSAILQILKSILKFYNYIL